MSLKIERKCNGNDRFVAQSASLLFAMQEFPDIISSNDKRKKKKKKKILELAWIEFYGRGGGR